MDVDLDGDKGRQLLRILIQMVIVNHPPLAADALNLLIRHFSQRKEMVQGFRQVRGLIHILAFKRKLEMVKHNT